MDPSYQASPAYLALPTSIYSKSNVRIDPEDPDCNWNDHTEVLGTAVAYISIMFVAFIVIVVREAYIGTMYAIGHLQVVIVLIIPNFFGLILYSLMIEADVPQIPTYARRLLYAVVTLAMGMSTLSPVIIDIAAPHLYQPSDDSGTFSYYYAANWTGVFLVGACYPLCILIICLFKR